MAATEITQRVTCFMHCCHSL